MIPNVGMAKRNNHTENRSLSIMDCLIVLINNLKEHIFALRTQGEKKERNKSLRFRISSSQEVVFSSIPISESTLFIILGLILSILF